MYFHNAWAISQVTSDSSHLFIFVGPHSVITVTAYYRPRG